MQKVYQFYCVQKTYSTVSVWQLVQLNSRGQITNDLLIKKKIKNNWGILSGDIISFFFPWAI